MKLYKSLELYYSCNLVSHIQIPAIFLPNFLFLCIQKLSYVVSSFHRVLKLSFAVHPSGLFWSSPPPCPFSSVFWSSSLYHLYSVFKISPSPCHPFGLFRFSPLLCYLIRFSLSTVIFSGMLSIFSGCHCCCPTKDLCLDHRVSLFWHISCTFWPPPPKKIPVNFPAKPSPEELLHPDLLGPKALGAFRLEMLSCARTVLVLSLKLPFPLVWRCVRPSFWHPLPLPIVPLFIFVLALFWDLVNHYQEKKRIVLHPKSGFANFT